MSGRSLSPRSMGMRFRPLLLLKSVFRTLGKRFLRFSSLKGVVEHSWATLFPIFATEVADEGVVWVEEERKCGGEYWGGTKKRRRPGGDAASLLLFVQHEHTLMGASP